MLYKSDEWLCWYLQSDQARADRLLKAQEEVQVEDEHIEGVQVFNQLQVEKERKESDRLAKLKAAQPTVIQEPAKDEVLKLDSPFMRHELFTLDQKMSALNLEA